MAAASPTGSRATVMRCVAPPAISRATRMATLLTVLVMGLALALPLALQRAGAQRARGQPAISPRRLGLSVYLKPQVSEQHARAAGADPGGHAGVAQRRR